jgi:hypothetical protein
MVHVFAPAMVIPVTLIVDPETATVPHVDVT